ncbi:MAG: 6-phosphogluconolactonase [Phycisphaerales bacterium JB043]
MPEPSPHDPEIYALDTRPRTPKLPGHVNHQASCDAALDALTHDLASHATECVRRFGDFHIALPGGEEFDRLYLRLLIDPSMRIIAWERTHVWIHQEEREGIHEPTSALTQVREHIVEHTDIPMSQVHAMHTNEPDAPALFTKEMRDVLGWRPKGHDRLDYALVPTSRCVVSLESKQFAVDNEARTSLTDHVLSASRLVAVLATGVEHRQALADVEQRFGSGRHRYPLMPHAGVLCWYLDHDACPELPDGA